MKKRSSASLIRKFTESRLFFPLLALSIILLLAGLLLSACSSIGGPTPTEVEIIFDPAEAQTPAASSPISTPTLRPTHTATATLSPTDIPTPTNTLDPYHALIAQGIQQREAGEFDQSIATISEAIKMDTAQPGGLYPARHHLQRQWQC